MISDFELKLRLKVFIAFQKAMIGEIIPSLRGISIEWNNNANIVKCWFFHDGLLTSKIEAYYSSIFSKIPLASFQGLINLDYEIVYINYPTPLPHIGSWIYLRREPFIPIASKDTVEKEPAVFKKSPKSLINYLTKGLFQRLKGTLSTQPKEPQKQKSPKIIIKQKLSQEEEDFIDDQIIGVQHGLLAEVIPQLRGVAIEWDKEEQTVWFVFYHDGPLNDEIEEHYSCISFETGASFSGNRLVYFDDQVIRLDYPAPFPPHIYWGYKRHEPFEDP